MHSFPPAFLTRISSPSSISGEYPTVMNPSVTMFEQVPTSGLPVELTLVTRARRPRTDDQTWFGMLGTPSERRTRPFCQRYSQGA